MVRRVQEAHNVLPFRLNVGTPIFQVQVPLLTLDADAASSILGSFAEAGRYLRLDVRDWIALDLTVSAPSTRLLSIAKFGYGIGTGPLGVGVLRDVRNGGGVGLAVPSEECCGRFASTGVPSRSPSISPAGKNARCQDVGMPLRMAAPTSSGIGSLWARARLSPSRLSWTMRSTRRTARPRMPAAAPTPPDTVGDLFEGQQLSASFPTSREIGVQRNSWRNNLRQLCAAMMRVHAPRAPISQGAEDGGQCVARYDLVYERGWLRDPRQPPRAERTTRDPRSDRQIE